MKKSIFIILSLVLLFSQDLLAQYGFSYQAAARDAMGQAIVNETIGIRFTILETDATGNLVFQETHQVTTNNFGMFNLFVGEGNVLQGDLLSIAWKEQKHFLQVEMDETGGPNYTLMGTSEMKLHPAIGQTEENIAGQGIEITNGIVTNTGDLDTSNELQNLSLNGQTLSLSNNGGSVNLPTQNTAGTGIAINNGIIENTGDLDATNEFQTLSLSGQTLTLSNSGGTVNLAAGSSIIQVINQINHDTIDKILEGSIINVQGMINLSAYNNRLDNHGITIMGGGFSGTGSQEISLGENTYLNVIFSDLIIDAYRKANFINCKFYNCAIEDGNYENCKFYNSISDEIESISNSSISGCNFEEIQSISGSDINNSTIGSLSGFVFYANGNEFEDCIIFPRIFTGNICEDSKLNLKIGAETTITGNDFDRPLDGETEIIFCDVTGSSSTQFLISSNVFQGGNSDEQAIRINGNYTGPLGLINITGNSFTNFERAITTNTSSIKTSVNNNTAISQSIEFATPSLGGNYVVRDNDVW